MFNFDNQYGYMNYNVEINNDAVRFNALQKARKDLVGEIQAVIEYDSHIHSSNDKLAIETWTHIKNEELAHVGELLGLINYLDPTQKQYVQKGLEDFISMQK